MSETDIPEVNDAGFESEVMQAEGPTLVVFWADWSGPCRVVESALSELAETYADSVRVVRVDVDSNPRTPNYYGIDSIPSFVRIEDGEVVDRVLGAVPKPRLERLFEP